MPVFEVIGGSDRRSLIKRFERKSKHDAVSELVDFHLLHCSRIETLEAEAQALREEVERGNRITCAMALDIAAVGEALGIPGEQQEGGTGEFIDFILELKRDAERYRWVKQRAWYVDRAAEVYEIDHVRVAGFKEAVPVDDDDVQAAIDAAMSEEAGDRGDAHE